MKPLNDIAKMIDVVYKSNLIESHSIKEDLINFINDDLVPRILIRNMSEIENKREDDIQSFFRNEGDLKRILLKGEKQEQNHQNIQKGIKKVLQMREYDHELAAEEFLQKGVDSNSGRGEKTNQLTSLAENSGTDVSKMRKAPKLLKRQQTEYPEKSERQKTLAEKKWDKITAINSKRLIKELYRNTETIEISRKRTDLYCPKNARLGSLRNKKLND